tara:strand:+ start:530 stop:718 length:189 start_codon:yes stop_codon:yes gene_type:complete
MPSNSKATPHQHQVLINQSLLNQIKQDVKYMKQDLVEIKAMIKYIKEYTEQKKEKEDARWFR